MLLKLVSLPGIVPRSLTLFLAVFLLSESVVAAPGRMGASIAQQPAATSQDATRSAAFQAYMEAMQLGEQRTVEGIRKAIAKFEEAVPLFHAVGERNMEATTLKNIGIMYYTLGDKQTALNYYNRALPLYQAINHHLSQAATLKNIGAVYFDLEEYQKALDYYNPALQLYQELRKLSDLRGESALRSLPGLLNDIGNTYSLLGQQQKALDFYNQALTLHQQLDNQEGQAITLFNLGALYSELKENSKALDYFNQALQLFRQFNDQQQEAETLYRIGVFHYELEENRKALDFFNQALKLFGQLNNQQQAAKTLDSIGDAYSKIGENQKALDAYNQALKIFRGLDNQADVADTLTDIGTIYSSISEQQQALTAYNQALQIYQKLNNRDKEARRLINIGEVHIKLGETQKGFDAFNRALEVSIALKDHTGEVRALSTIGNFYQQLGDHLKAREYLNKVLQFVQTQNDKEREASTLTNLGQVYERLGEYQQALNLFNQALRLWRTLKKKANTAATLFAIAQVYRDLGDEQQALNFLDQALSLFQSIEDREKEAFVLVIRGDIYRSLNEYQQALDSYQQALPIQHALGNRGLEAMALTLMANVYFKRGESQQALDYSNQALQVARAAGEPMYEGMALLVRATFFDELGEYRKAIDDSQQALKLSRSVGDRGQETEILGSIARSHRQLKEYQQALDNLTQGLRLAKVRGDRSKEADLLYGIARVESDKGNLKEALTQINAAIEIIENLRTNVASKELRASYFASKQNYYELYIDLLMQLHKINPSKGYDALALHASERSRARSLLELLTEANADIRSGVDPKLLEQERTLKQQLDAAEQNQVKLRERQDAKEQLEANKQQIESFLTQLEQVEGQIRATSPRYATLKYPQPLTVPEIQQQVLDDNTLLLQYSLGKERSYLWAVTKTGMTSYTLPGQAEIEKAADSFYSAISSPGSPNDVIEPGQRLNQLIKLDAIMPLLQGKKLLIAADGTLHRIPFAALPNPNSPGNYQPLLLEHEIINLPSISAIATLRQTSNRPPAPKTLAVVADPVFSKTDERVSGQERPSPCANVPFRTASDTNPSPESALALQLQTSKLERSIRDLNLDNIQRLPNTRREAERILATIPNEQRTAVCDFEANRDWVTQQGILDQYRYLLFATHGLINTREPEESSLVLSLVDQRGESRYGLLRLGDIFNLNLNAELAILSACQTGRGKEVRGEGLIGLTRGFMYAGARRVLVSLWNVNDSKTADLMEFFSRQVMQDNRAPATALQAAQKQMWQTQQGTEYQHPYYWAAFTLQGEWRK